MTDDELDLLASAYVDGEATPDEVALVERDPELLARVEVMRTMVARVATPPPDPAVKEQHLAAALAAFAGTAAEPAAEPAEAEVVDFGQRAASRAERRAAKPPRSLPTWLPAAAVFILLSGGVIFAATNLQGDDDMDAAAFDTTESGSDDAAEESEDASAEAAPAAEAEAVMADEAAGDSDDAMADDAMEDDAMEDEEAMEEEAADDGSAGGDDADTSARSTTTGGFFPEEPVIVFAAPPSEAEAVAAIDQDLRDIELSRCGTEVVVPAAAVVIGYLPIEVDDVRGELFLLDDGDGGEIPILLDEDCLPITP